jgi:hypothetical protein
VYSSLEWWQVLLNAISGVMIVGGAIGLIVAAKRHRRGKRRGRDLQARSLAIVSVASLAIAALGRLVFGQVLQPAPSFVNSSERFLSRRNPAIEVSAPAGWRVSFDSRTARVVVGNGRSVNDDTFPRLVIESNLTEDVVNSMKVAHLLVEQVLALPQGKVLLQPTETSLHSRPAVKLATSIPAFSSCAWLVKRGSHYASDIVCLSRGGEDPCKACQPVLDTLRWINPTDVEPKDLD